MRLTDGKKIVEIALNYWTGDIYTPDFSDDFFAGVDLYDEDAEAWLVPDVDYCIAYAEDWRDLSGDFYGDEDARDAELARGWERHVYVDVIRAN